MTMTRSNKIGGHCTNVIDVNGILAVQYHGTLVVRVLPESIELDTGGWFTATTKLRMNQASNQWCLGYRVYQRDFTWYVAYKGGTYQFCRNKLILKR